MTVREIVFVPEPVLRKKAKTVTKFDEKLQTLIDDMVETMRQAPGFGLAAPQVAESVRLFVAEIDASEENPGGGQTYVVFNPEYVLQSAEMAEGVEGCLSIPGWAGQVTRHHKIVIKGLDKLGRRVHIEAMGLLARVFQHEIDHLDGILATDRAVSPRALMTRKRWLESQ